MAHELSQTFRVDDVAHHAIAAARVTRVPRFWRRATRVEGAVVLLILSCYTFLWVRWRFRWHGTPGSSLPVEGVEGVLEVAHGADPRVLPLVQKTARAVADGQAAQLREHGELVVPRPQRVPVL